MQEDKKMKNKDYLIKYSNAIEKPVPSNRLNKRLTWIPWAILAGVLVLSGIGFFSISHVKAQQTYNTLNNETTKVLKDKNINSTDVIKLFDRIATYDTTCKKLHQMEKLDPSIKSEQRKLMNRLNQGEVTLADSKRKMNIHTRIHNKRWQITIKETRKK